MNLIGKAAIIIKASDQYKGEWGIIKHFDGDYYHIALWNGDTSLIFSRDEFRIPRRQIIGGVDYGSTQTKSNN